MGKYKPTELKTTNKNYQAWCYNVGKTYDIIVEIVKDGTWKETFHIKLRTK